MHLPTADSSGSSHADFGRRLRVLYLIDNLIETGGAERFALGLATHLPADRFEVWVCSTRRQEPLAVQALADAGVRHLHLGRRAKWDVYRFLRLIALMRRERFDIVHAHMFGSNTWATVFGKLTGVPVIVAHEHNWSYTGDPLRVWVDREVIGRFATQFVAVSRANRERMIELEGIPGEKIRVLPTAYIPSPDVSDGDIRAELGLGETTPLIATVAVLREEKALEVLIEAHAQLQGPGAAAHLVLIGDGPRRPDLERRVAELDTADRVHFLGFRRDVDSILRAVDVCAMSSDWEGMPLFALESMAAGIPLVATSVGGVPEIIDDEVTGLLVPPRDPPALAAALSRLLDDQALRESLGASASSRIEELGIDRVAGRFADLYDSLLARQVTSRRRRPFEDVLVLCYHAISPDWTATLSVTPEEFEYQLSFLLGRGWRAATFTQAVLDPPARRTLAVTFDDAYTSIHTYAAPILARLGIPATVFVPTEFASSGRPLLWPGIDQWDGSDQVDQLLPMSWDTLRELADAGWEIGSHTRTHPRLTELDDDHLDLELAGSREACSRELGRPCDSIAYPYGAVDERVARAAEKAGYRTGAALSHRLELLGPYRFPRVGIYRADARWRFHLKAARLLRMIRAYLALGRDPED
jgi:glycosyltransferase involved in cell wall biosynthesis/peptidoglycan/xylan/chitin deacetylase (PgdA/CDA1 family)